MTTSKTRPKYEPPEVVTYQEDDILKQMGPVGGCYSVFNPYSSGAPMNPFGYRSRHPGKRGRRYRSSLRASRLEDYEDDLYDDSI